MTDILIHTTTILVLLAGMAALVAWVRRDTYSSAPQSVVRRRAERDEPGPQRSGLVRQAGVQ